MSGHSSSTDYSCSVPDPRLAQAEPARAYARVQTHVREYDFQILSYDVKFIKQNWKETLYTSGIFEYFE